MRNLVLPLLVVGSVGISPDRAVVRREDSGSGDRNTLQPAPAVALEAAHGEPRGHEGLAELGEAKSATLAQEDAEALARARYAAEVEMAAEARVLAEEAAKEKARTRRPGLPGKRGSKGKVGLPGQRGPPGIMGENGKQGVRGPMGDVGPDGYRGPQGEMGPRGQQGKKGEKGENGYKGEPGDRGDRGPTGVMGLPGLDGERGLPGDPGQRGDRGVDGPAGRQGDKGPFGAPGMKGPTGSRGPPGPKGAHGKNGTSAVISPAVDCSWSQWLSWQDCTKTCDRGRQRRERYVTLRAKDGGKACPGFTMEYRDCHKASCPFDLIAELNKGVGQQRLMASAAALEEQQIQRHWAMVMLDQFAEALMSALPWARVSPDKEGLEALRPAVTGLLGLSLFGLSTLAFALITVLVHTLQGKINWKKRGGLDSLKPPTQTQD